jgi:hypothetical protein
MILDTKRFEIQPLHAEALPDVVAFLGRWPSHPDERPSLRRLQWLLLDNPLAALAGDHGLCVRDASGAIAGLLLAFPGAFRAGETPLLAMGSGGYFVEPAARTLGFYLFKRHLQRSGFAFFYSTSCNAASGALWRALGGCAVGESDVEYVLPLDLGTVLSASLAIRTSSALAVGAARLLGRCATGLWRPGLPTNAGVVTEPCRDWDKLADLARRHRPACITADRSAAFLEWRYGPGSPNHASDIRVFRDARGNEGWFSLDATVRGDRTPVRGRVLLDATWPRDRMGFQTVLAAVARFAGPDADAIYFRPRPGVDYGDCRPWIIRRRREPPSVFAVTAKGGAPLAVSSLDIVLGDGDGGVPVSGAW